MDHRKDIIPLPQVNMKENTKAERERRPTSGGIADSVPALSLTSVTASPISSNVKVGKIMDIPHPQGTVGVQLSNRKQKTTHTNNASEVGTMQLKQKRTRPASALEAETEQSKGKKIPQTITSAPEAETEQPKGKRIPQTICTPEVVGTVQPKRKRTPRPASAPEGETEQPKRKRIPQTISGGNQNSTPNPSNALEVAEEWNQSAPELEHHPNVVEVLGHDWEGEDIVHDWEGEDIDNDWEGEDAEGQTEPEMITARRGVGTSATRTHLKRCKVRKNVTNVARQLISVVMSPEGVALENWRFSQDVSRNELVRMISLHGFPLAMVDYDGFRRAKLYLSPSSDEWEKAQKEVKIALENGILEQDAELIDTIKFMQAKLKKYWKLTWLQVSFSVIFDPRFKLAFIDFRLRQAFGNSANSKIDIVKKVLLGLFKDYSDGYQETRQVSDVRNASGRYADWDTHMRSSACSTSEVPSELESYLTKPPISRSENFDILAWWKSNASEYPTISRMARDILAVQASTVASESAFSMRRRILSDFRSRLTSKTVEALAHLNFLWKQLTLVISLLKVWKFEQHDQFQSSVFLTVAAGLSVQKIVNFGRNTILFGSDLHVA
ncbi:hypothetical protein U9M48_011702 [Paspalum notatum var. saurae]|uniref:HAT C-terminal dimerisation domain-containing protein n=1 Tax=Paspalum notatum var. saurae TaxID=547442 RepID=A0AAQ3SWU9_PASNO